MMAKTLYRPIATVFLILFALGSISTFSWVFFLLLSVVLAFILVAHYAHSNALRKNPAKEEMDLGGTSFPKISNNSMIPVS